MKARKILSWVVPAFMFAAAGFVAILKSPQWQELTRQTYATFTDYGSTTAG